MSKHDVNKKQRLKNFDFSKEGMSMHLVADWQGGPANGEPVIMTKATDDLSYEQVAKAADVTVELSMEEFLRRFFSMWYDDAASLASLLGYEVESEEDRYEWKPLDKQIEELSEKVTLMKKAWASDDLVAESKLELLKFQESLEKALINASTEAETHTAEQGINKSKEEITDMSKENVETVSKAQLEEMISKAVEAQKAETEELKKALESEKEARKAEKEAVLKAELKKSVDGITLLSDESKESVQDYLFKARQIEGGEVILKALSEMQEGVNKALTTEQGVETHVEAADVDDDPLLKAVMSLNTTEA